MTWQFTLTGLLIGVLVGLTGMGGGSLMTPILVIVFGFKPTYAVGTDIVHGAIFKTFSDRGPEPRNIQRVRCPCTVPRRWWRSAPNVWKIAPCTMSVPTAYVGLNPKTITRIGVISEPPPMPVSPTIEPIRRPVSVNCHVTLLPHWAEM